MDMTSTLAPPSDELVISDSVREFGISKITRHGSTKEGFVIHVTIGDRPLVFAVGSSWSSALTNLKKACDRFDFDNGSAHDNKIKTRELLCILESTLVQNHSWVMGYDIKADENGYSVRPNSSDDVNDIHSTPSLRNVSIPEAIRTHSGTIVTSGIIIAVSDVFQLIRRARWTCYQCDGIIEREVVNVLDVPTKPRECIMCSSKLGFTDHQSTAGR